MAIGGLVMAVFQSFLFNSYYCLLYRYDKGAYLFLRSYIMRTHGAKQQREAIKRAPKQQLTAVFEVWNISFCCYIFNCGGALFLDPQVSPSGGHVVVKDFVYIYVIRLLIHLATRSGRSIKRSLVL